MNRRILEALPILTVVALAACSGGAMNRSLLPSNAAITQDADLPPDALAGPASGDVPFLTADPVRRLCTTPGTADRMQCLASVRTDIKPTLIASNQIASDVQSAGEACPFSAGEGYCPIDLQQAYKLPSLTRGKEKTVAIVDAFGYKRAASDLAVFRKTMGLKACGTADKCLRIVNQQGHSSPLPHEPPASDDWRGETSLDLDMVSGICPNCKIILVQSDNNDTRNLYAGVATAGRLGVKYIGVSWGGRPELPDNKIFHQPGVVIVASAGDNGGGIQDGGGPIQPCTFTYVVCVGGTRLVRAQNPRGWSESVWNDFTFDACGGPCGATGSACSASIAKPSWQTDTGCKRRSAADTSASASLRSPVIVYNSEIEGGSCNPPACFWAFGGTSESAQIIAAVYALAENAANQMGASYFWKHHKDNVYDVVHGNNTDPGRGITCASSITYICTARLGFDGPTGWGSPKGIGAF
ncbi:MAG: S8 family serine peptidase [Candidatus Cybelea sp.]